MTQANTITKTKALCVRLCSFMMVFHVRFVYSENYITIESSGIFRISEGGGAIPSHLPLPLPSPLLSFHPLLSLYLFSLPLPSLPVTPFPSLPLEVGPLKSS